MRASARSWCCAGIAGAAWLGIAGGFLAPFPEADGNGGMGVREPAYQAEQPWEADRACAAEKSEVNKPGGEAGLNPVNRPLKPASLTSRFGEGPRLVYSNREESPSVGRGSSGGMREPIRLEGEGRWKR